MKVHQYAEARKLTTATVLGVLKQLAASDPLGTLSKVTHHNSVLTDDHIAALDRHYHWGDETLLHQNQTEEQIVDSVIPAPEEEQEQHVADPDEVKQVDKMFGADQSQTKLVPMRRWGLRGRRLSGDKGPKVIKCIIDANDESEAVRIACEVRFGVIATDYKFQVIKISDLEPKRVKGTPLVERSPLPV